MRFYTFFLDNLHQIPHAHVLLAEGVILIKRLVAAMLTGRTAHSKSRPAGRNFRCLRGGFLHL